MYNSGQFQGNHFQIDPYKVAIYIRWSTDDQANGTTLEIQSEACRLFVQSQGWVYRPELVFVDDGYSGGDLKRPGLSRLRDLVQSGQVQCVVVFKIDRLSRSVIDTVNLVLKEWEGTCYVKSTREPIDTTTAMGKQFFYMLVSYAEWERSVIRERTYGGKMKRASEGRNAGQKYPFGFKKADVVTEANHGWAIDGWDPQRKCFTGDAAVVRRIFDLFLTGISMPKIADALNAEGVKCPEGGKAWRYSYVGRVLANQIYCGRYHWGRKTKAKKKKNEDPMYKVEGLPAIVSEQEFDTVQAMRKQKAERYSKAAPGQYLLSGLAVCGKCGEKLGGSKGETKRYYVCIGKTILKKCDCAYMDKEILERKVLEIVREEIAPYNVEHQVQKIKVEFEQRREEAARNLNLIRAEIASIEKKKANLDQLLLSGNLQVESYEDLKCTIQREMTQATERLQRAEVTLRNSEIADVDTEKLTEMGRRIDAWAKLNFEELRQLLHELVADLRIYQLKVNPKMKKMLNPNPILIEWTPRIDVVLLSMEAQIAAS